MTASHLREEVKNRVRDVADVVQVIGEYVDLKKAGTRFTGLCPFHAEKTPSFSVNPQGQFFHCFGCGESGDVFSFLMKHNRLSFPEALEELARKYQIDLPEPQLSDADRKRVKERETLYRVNEEATVIYQQYLDESSGAKKARAYLADRGVPPEVTKSFRLGYAPDPSITSWSFVTSGLQRLKLPIADIERAGLAVKNDRGGYYDRFRDRVLFPILDMTGRVVAFGGRILGDGQPKYMNSPESPVFDKSRLLFGLYQHREGIRACRQAIVVEGNFDLLLLAVHGFDNVVAPLGTALTSHHVRSLRGYCDEVVLLFDGDSAGLKAAMRSIPFFLAEQVNARVAVLPPEHDPDSLVLEKGPEGIRDLVSAAAPLAEFVYEYLVKQHGLTLEGKNRIVKELQEIIAASSDSMQHSLMTAHFSEMLGIPLAQFEAGRSHQGEIVEQDRRPMRQSIAQLPRKQRQLVDFIVYYPEYLDELLAGGLEAVVTSESISDIITCLRQLAEDGTPSPDRLLSRLPEKSSERKYVTELLISGSPIDDNGEGQESRLMCDELLQWLQAERKQKESASLMQLINEAQRAGNHELLLRLLQQKQEMGKNN